VAVGVPSAAGPQLAAPQVLPATAPPAHEVVVRPSQICAEQGLSGLLKGQGGREPWGAPPTAVQVPSLPLASHASHCPVQLELQQ